MNAIIEQDQFLLPIELSDDMTFDQWEKLVERLIFAKHDLEWAIGDIIRWGSDEKRFGRKALERAVRLLALDNGRLKPTYDTCVAFPPETRRKELKFDYYLAVHDRDDRHELIERVISEGLSLPDLRSELRVASDRQSTFGGMDADEDDPVDDGYRAIMIVANRVGLPEARRMAVESLVNANYGAVNLKSGDE